MLKTSIDRKVFVFFGAALYVLVALCFPVLFVAWLAVSGFVGTTAVALFLYDWILSADEALFEEAEEQRRQRGIDG